MSEPALRVIIVEDNPSDAALMARRLWVEGFQLDWQQVEDEKAYRAALEGACDLILSDWALPGFSGLRALQIARQLELDIPFIIVSGSIGEEAAVAAMRLGACDYLLKDRLERLGQAVQAALQGRQLREEYRQAERQLRLQSSALNAAANAIVITNRDGAIELVNQAFVTLTGYTEAEALGKNLRELIKSDKQPAAFYQEMWGTILNGKVWHGELINRRKDGQLYYEEQTITPVTNPDGQIGQFIAIKQDISRRKQTELNLRKSEERFREVAENAGEWIWETDAGGLYRYSSSIVQKILGYTPEELVGQIHIYDLVAASQNERIVADLHSKIEQRELVHALINPFVAKDGREVTLLTSGAPVLDENGVFLGYRGTGLDITERVKTEQALQYSEERYRNLVQLSPDAIFINRNDRIDYLNPAALELFGANSPEQVLGQPVLRFFHPDFHTQIRARIWKMQVEHTNAPLVEEVILRLDGSQRDVEVTAAPFVDSNGPALQVILRDVTARKQTENKLFETSEELRVAYDATLEGWSHALELRERETAGHSQRVVRLTLQLARALQLDESELIHIQRGARLHDIGKMGIPDHILLKPGPLTDDEWVIMRQHPVYSYNLLSKIPYLRPALDIPYGHHERWDGSGYPQGLKGEEIPLTARIFAVIDVWDALSCDRPYRPAWTEEAVIAYLQAQAGKQFDPRIVAAFLALQRQGGLD